MKTECNPEQLEFHALGRRDVAGRYDGGRITSDGGGLLPREVDKRIGLLNRLAGCFNDYRNPNAIEHSVPALVAQRVYGLALGYEDLNDHDAGFCREAIMAWCETHKVRYVLGLACNKRLQRALGKEIEEARVAHERTGQAARRFRDFRYKTRKSWSRERRVIGKAEYLPGKANPRFVVTNLAAREASTAACAL